ncbi:DUF2975 domain-containing protein [Mycoplasmatota bacterium]|nr:DUF2975 domain-containing protein [Mycoplasmatota bacterium]
MKKYYIYFLKTTTLLASLPVLFLCLYYFPILFVEGSKSDSVYVPYLFMIMISFYLMAVPYFMSLIETFKLLINTNKNEFLSQLSIQSLNKIKYMAFCISIIFMIDLPVIYFIANMDDAPGLILFGGFFVLLSLTIGVFSGLIKNIIKDNLHQQK